MTHVHKTVRAALAAAALALVGAAAATAADAPALPAMTAATAGDAAAQLQVADAYYYGQGVKQSYKQARAWYEKAAVQQNPVAMRRLGQMYARGEGGKKNPKKAVEQWIAAEKLGDTESLILVADAYYKDITNQDTPKPGKIGFVNGEIPVNLIDDALAWYQAALDRDPRPEVKQRAEMGIYVLKTVRQAGGIEVKKQ